MKAPLDRAAAEAYASWFRCVADPTRLQVLHVLASARRPLRVGDIAEAVGVAQSTVSAHLKRLLADEFVLVEHVGTASWFRVNAGCIEEFPAAAEQVMGHLTGTVGRAASAAPPWRGRAASLEGSA
jgi:DNA-binding transcriptional ArsR family regulator